MNKKLQTHFTGVLHHLYINPIERCNLACKICYTKKSSFVLKEKEITDFINRYDKIHKVKIITFCGGEVFLLPYFPKLVNKLTERDIYTQIITNGTIDRLSEFSNRSFINLIVSLDGLQHYHDSNRGKGNFQKVIKFLKKVQKMGLHTEIFSIVTKENFRKISAFENYLKNHFADIPITYHPRKPPSYLLNHPVSNIFGELKNFGFPTKTQLTKLLQTKKVFPPRNLGCWQIALFSDGKVYGCCEGTTPIGNINDPIENLVNELQKRLILWSKTKKSKSCLGCSQPDFVCGLNLISYSFSQFFNNKPY